jgi:histone H3/H4
MSDNDDDLCIPRSAMYKLIKEIAPQVRLSGEAKDLIASACNEFIHLLATEANNVCEKQSKKLILPDHVLSALDNLGFSEYKEDCVEVMKQMQQEVDKRKKLRHKLDKPGIPEEELLRQQNQLFAEARQQQAMLENAEEWSKVQMEAQLALQRQSNSTFNLSNNNNGASAAFNNSLPFNMNNHNQNNIFTNNSFNSSTSFTMPNIMNNTKTNKNNNQNDDDDNYD